MQKQKGREISSKAESEKDSEKQQMIQSRMIMRNIFLPVLFLPLLSAGILHAQSAWQVPDEAQQKLSIRTFDGDMERAGQQIYQEACMSCHGTPGQGDFTMMVPPPGDIAEDRFHSQPDGALFYKIGKGRDAMPSFENTLSEDEIWSLIAYIRSFHEGYVQKMPDLEGIEIPVLELDLGYDENVDKLVVKVADSARGIVAGANVRAYIKGMFGDHYLGKDQTNEFGVAYVDIDASLPGDSEGFVTVLIKADLGYGRASLTQEIMAAKPAQNIPVTAGRHLWSPARKAPVWMIVIFNLIGIGVWATIFYIIFGLRKIRKLQKN